MPTITAAPTYPGTSTPIEAGDHLAALGLGEGDDYGTVQFVDPATVTVHWRGSETTVDHPIASLAGVEVYTDLAAARAAYRAAHPAE